MFAIEKMSGKINHLNVRKEAAGDDEGAVVAADVKFTLEAAPAEILKQLAPDDGKGHSIVDALFRDDGVSRFRSFKRIDFDVEFKDHDVFLGQRHFEHSTLKNFAVIKLHDGAKIDLEFTIQTHPKEEQVGSLAERIKEDVSLKVVGQPSLPL